MRRKLWEDPDIQCSVLGTCMTMRELRRIARRHEVDLGRDPQEFEIHAAFVRLCAEPGPVARAVNKALDRKYAASIRTFAKARCDEDVLRLWQQARAAGDIPGPYWAAITHPELSMAARSIVFGQVHMLSHLMGAANRADIRRLAELEGLLDKAEQRHADAKADYRSRIKRLARENGRLHKRLREVAKEAETLRARTKPHADAVLRSENEALHRSLGDQSLQLMELRRDNEALKGRAEAYATRLKRLERELSGSRAEAVSLRQALAHPMPDGQARIACPLGCEQAGTEDCPGPDLCGKRILYVGGRTGLVPHYRSEVERRGGAFLHHDGGLEQAPQALPGMLGGVDAVLCPVDCVSHDACKRVKEACKTSNKPCMMLRSSGLSSLARSLEELMGHHQPRRSP